MCTYRKTIIFFEVKVDVQKGALRFKEIFDNGHVSFIQLMFSSIVVRWSQSLMTIMYVLIKVSIWVPGFYKQEALEGLMGFLKFCSLDCG